MSKFSFLIQETNCDFISPCLPIYLPLPSSPLPGKQERLLSTLNTPGSHLLTLPPWDFALFFQAEVILFPFLFQSCSKPRPRLRVLPEASKRSLLILTELHRPKVHKVFPRSQHGPTSHRTPHREEAAGVSSHYSSQASSGVTERSLQGRAHLYTRNATDVPVSPHKEHRECLSCQKVLTKAGPFMDKLVL